jgi:hypothetical protein
MQSVREKAEDQVRELVKRIRSGDLDIAKPTAEDLFLMMNGENGKRGLTAQVPVNWRRELIFLLGNVSDVPFWRICQLVGISSQRVFIERQKDRVLADAVQAYQAAWYERQAEDPSTDLAPSLVTFGLKARAGWKDQQLDALSPDQLRVIIDKIIDQINTHVADPEVRAKLGEAILLEVEAQLR